MSDDNIMGMMLVTPQTSAEGKKVNQVLICEDVYYPGETETEEYYMSVLIKQSHREKYDNVFY